MINDNLVCGRLGEANLIIDLIPISNTTSRPQIKMVPKYITVHNTGNSKANARQNSDYVDTATGYVSWHFTIDDKDIFQELPLNETAWHAGDSRGQGNMASIGIEICEHVGIDWEKAKANAVYLIRTLMADLDIPIENVVPHQKWSGKYCPHKILDEGWDKFVNLIKDNGGIVTTSIEKEEVVNKVDTSKYPILRHKDNNAHVRILEEKLRDLGYMSRFVDSYFGTVTIDAVKKFQSDRGLTADAIVGQKTWRTLFEIPSGSVTPPVADTPKMGYEKIRFAHGGYKTDVHVYRTKTVPELVLGVRNKLETLPEIARQYGNVKAAMNAGLFAWDGSANDGYGLIITSNGEKKDVAYYFQGSSKNFVDMIANKDGSVKIELVPSYVQNIPRLVDIQKNSYWGVAGTYALKINGKDSQLNWKNFSHYLSYTNRTILGIDKNGIWHLIVADCGTNGSKGLRAIDQLQLCNELDLVDAVSFDGGGSSDLMVGGKVVSGNMRAERKIATAFIIR